MHHQRALNPRALEALVARGLDPDIIEQMGLYSARKGERDSEGNIGNPIPDPNGSVVCYPYLNEDEYEENTKFVARRNNQKIYWQEKDKRKLFYNLPVLREHVLHTGDKSLLIVEGENDCLAGKTAGYPWTVSVPAGGDPAIDPKTKRIIPMKPDSELDPENDVKFEYIINSWDLLSPIKSIIIWTDWDAVGERLRTEIARRLGRIRCRFVPQPEDIARANVVFYQRHNKEGILLEEGHRACKDINEVLQHFGPERVMQIITTAKPIPVTGLYTLDDFPEVTRVLYSTGFKALDPLIQLYEGAFVVSSGLPGSGKSQLWNQIAFNCALNHGWRIAIASFEAEVRPDLIRQLRAFYLQKDYREWTSHDRREADEWIKEYFVFITRDPEGLDDQLCTLPWVCEKMEDAVVRFGIRMSITDPWNQIDHVRNPGERGDEYLIRAIKMIKDTGKRLKLANVVVAHPDKSAGKESMKDNRIMGMYDISDGAGWYNAAELGVIVYRANLRDTVTRVIVRKRKFRGTGQVGDAVLQFDEQAEMFDTDLVPIVPQ